ncbi:MAG: hypothetical protein JRE57_00030 [Deltaproteobacteria bacterium]|nr:hypothetical protein [Deltaproteobacteria bacterium]
MALPILLKTGSVSGAGSAGQGANDLVVGETVTITDLEPANAGETRLTVFEDVPVGSALSAMTDPTSDAPNFIPDADGSYRIKMTVVGVWTATEVYAVPLANTGSRIPSFQERSEYDGNANVLGWHEAMTQFMRIVDGAVVPIIIYAGGRHSHDSDTPLVVSQFQFNPSNYGLPNALRQLSFRAIGANGGGAALTKARLYSVTDTEYIGSGLSFTSALPAVKTEVLAMGSGAGQVDLSNKMYECRVWVDTPDAVDDAIEFGGAELRIENL